MILQRSAKQHSGKTISCIETDSLDDGLVMCGHVRILFTDGTHISLKPDWRGDECYISEHNERKETIKVVPAPGRS